MRPTAKLTLIIFCAVLTFKTFGQRARVATPSKYVIVHGAWGGSWAFRAIDSLLTAQGHLVSRPSLTGQGERVHLATRDVNLSTHIADVVNHILFEDLRNVILVGHSYGGMVITGVADSIPERISQLVYLDAFVPRDGESVITITGSDRQGWLTSMEKNGFLVPPWVRADQRPPKDVPHPVQTFKQPIRLDNPQRSKIPTAYILTVDAGKKPEQDDFASSYQRAKENKWKTFIFESDHNPQWSAPARLAEALNGFAQ